ncbi:AbfB domain-containing protein [Streptomyces litchfieldiae]|uniref:AbfB domain-containing protein n=1 Tax=Streptomyces litchfieldiae TaxID=3075543 RepID=UPI00374E02C7
MRQSATFTIVPGLADPNCYSFRDSTGRYLRHYAWELRVDPCQDTATFRADARSRPSAPGRETAAVCFMKVR